MEEHFIAAKWALLLCAIFAIIAFALGWSSGRNRLLEQQDLEKEQDRMYRKLKAQLKNGD